MSIGNKHQEAQHVIDELMEINDDLYQEIVDGLSEIADSEISLESEEVDEESAFESGVDLGIKANGNVDSIWYVEFLSSRFFFVGGEVEVLAKIEEKLEN